MSVFTVTVTLNAADLLPSKNGITPEMVKVMFVEKVINPARAAAKNRLHDTRVDTAMDADLHTIDMAQAVRDLMLTMAMESSIQVQAAPPGTKVETRLPFERQYVETPAVNNVVTLRPA